MNSNQLRSNDDGQSNDDSAKQELDAYAALGNSNQRLLYHTLGIFQNDIYIPQHVVVRLWQAIAPDYDEARCIELLDMLVDLVLIERHTDQTVTVRDLRHDYTLGKLGERSPQIHNTLLAAYNPNEQPWHTISHDGYLYFHLAYHLHKAGRQAELYNLLTASPEWMDTQATVCLGYSGYIADLNLALADFSDPFPYLLSFRPRGWLFTHSQVTAMMISEF
jgi:hypothetical protein